MAAVHPYQRVLLANRDILLSDLPTEDVINFLEDHNVLNIKESENIKIGRSQRERRESLLDVLHYKGERGFNEFCRALDEYSPSLASRMSDKDPELTDKNHNERNTSTKYSSSYSDHERGYREINGDDFHRDSNRDREDRGNKSFDMKGEHEPHYARVNKRPRDLDRPADDNRSVSSHHSRYSERGGRSDEYRKTPRRADELNPAEHYILEKQTIHLEKANANQGFGIAVSGGLDNPHYKTGDTSIIVSDIVTGSPAHGLLRENDIIVQVNDVNVEKCYHRDAVQALKDAGTSARLIIMRRKVMPNSAIPSESKMDRSYQSATLPDRRSRSMPPTNVIHLKKPEKEGFGFSMAFRLYVKDVKRKGTAHYAGLQRDHVIQKINGRKTEELSLKEAIEMVRNSQDLDLVVAEKKLDRYSSTKSLPSVGKRGYENGLDNQRDEEPQLGDRRRAKSLDRKTMKDMRRSRGPSEKDKDKDKPTNDGFSIERTVELEKPVENLPETEIKPVQQQLRNFAPEDVFEKLESEKPSEPLVIKQEVKVEESLPDIPPRRYSDPELPEPPKLDEPDRGLEATWKHLQPDHDRDRDSDRGRDRDSDRGRDRDSDRGRDRDSDRGRDFDRDRDVGGREVPYVPQPADVTRTEGHVDLSMSNWDQGLSPGRGRADRSPGSTPQSQRRETNMDFINDRDTKSISFRKEGSLGIQIQGGNKVGIFVNAVRENNPAYKQGLRRGDQILMANDIDFKDITREEAVLLLLSLGDEVHLYSRPKMSTFERIKNSPGDSFYIKCHFDYTKMKTDELDMSREDVFHVWDTMYGGMIGSWHAQRVILSNDETETGVIPNKCRAEQLATVRQVEEDKTPKKAQRSNSLKRRDSRGGTLKKNYMFVSSDKLDKESFINMSKEFKLPAYERVSLRSPGFVRPVVLLGPIADITRDKLLRDMPDVFAVPTAYGGFTPAGQESPTKSSRRTLSYSTIKAVVDNGKHCLLDIAPDEVERLNYCQYYPIVIFLKAPSKTVLKEMRTQHGSSAKNVKKLYDNSVKLEQFYSNMFSTTIAAGSNDDWYSRVKEEIRRQQDRKVWMSEDKFEHEDMEFSLHPNRYSTGHEYDPHGDSPTARSSVSHPPEEEIHAQPSKDLESLPQMYNGPEVEYRPYDDGRNKPRYDDGPGRYDDDRDRDRGRYDDERDRDRGRYDNEKDQDRGRYDDEKDRDRGRYDDERGRYDDNRDRGRYGDEIPYDDSDVDRASKPGYKPHGNVVKVLPSSQEPGELRQSLRKTRPTSKDFADHPPELQDSDDMKGRDGLRKIDYEPRYDGYDGPNPTELELKIKAESLRKVESKPDVLNQYDERVGVKVSDLWAIDNELKRDEKRERIQPIEIAQVEHTPDNLEERLNELERAIPPPEVRKQVSPKPYRFESKQRNAIIDNRPGDRSESFVRTTYYPVRSHATVTHVGSKSEPEVRAQVTNSVESAPMENGFRSLPRDYGRKPEPDRIYRAEVTIPRKESKPDRPKSAYGYSSQAYAPKPYGTEHRSASPPPRPAQPINYDYRLSKPQTELRREPEPRPGTYRSDYKPKISDFESYRDDSQVITSDFESLDDDTQVVATARGTFTSEGGVLSSPETGVSIHIPQGAIEPNKEQEIYFKVCKDNNIMPPLDADKGETLLSPLVMCGPHGTQFLKPVELRLPHCASMTPDGWSFALKSSDTPTGMPTQWRNVSLPGQDNKDKCQVDPSSVSVLVDHF